eukprot:TRINITY_DN5438_c0_g1_i1.p1 TRINITY_DN5438_c0_g1~~TRINITY_DN5438_c0_g1_i1.p1  ORF type:complete len:349 (+),score=104.31 TRINITY_DN5438_c0_g1_i1:88-1134(+)
MTYTHRHINNIRRFAAGSYRLVPGRHSASPGAAQKGDWLALLWQYTVGSHAGHYLELIAALLIYNFAWPIEEAAEWHPGWVLRVVAANLLIGLSVISFWHWYTYVGPYAEKLRQRKYNPANQYEPDGRPVRMFRSATGNLEREVLYSTLGLLHSGLLQCLVMHLWAAGYFPYYTDFWSRPLVSVFNIYYVTYYRHLHFYWVHRVMHPWRWQLPLVGDPGLFLYRHFHSVHHKSYNPGPWSGLSMHPVEHLVYYSSVYIVLLFRAHPLHFLYIKCHADVSTVGGHDGIGDPSAGSDYHWLHHHKFEYNYGVPVPINFDKYFGTWMSYDDYLRREDIRAGGDAHPKDPSL